MHRHHLGEDPDTIFVVWIQCLWYLDKWQWWTTIRVKVLSNGVWSRINIQVVDFGHSGSVSWRNFVPAWLNLDDPALFIHKKEAFGDTHGEKRANLLNQQDSDAFSAYTAAGFSLSCSICPAVTCRNVGEVSERILDMFTVVHAPCDCQDPMGPELCPSPGPRDGFVGYCFDMRSYEHIIV
jgi:hypothetical protein